MSSTMRPDVSPASLIDLGRYPIEHADFVRARAEDFRKDGVCVMPGFIRPEFLQRLCDEADELTKEAFVVDTRPARVANLFRVVAYDQFPAESLARRLYEWDPLMRFIGGVLGLSEIHRFADKLSALNLSTMGSGGVQTWHFDATDFVVSIALRSSEKGGDFECASRIRSLPGCDQVIRDIVNEVDLSPVKTYPMVPGTLMVFGGRFSFHRVSPVVGTTSRHVLLLSYDSKPGTTNTEQERLVRYGRNE